MSNYNYNSHPEIKSTKASSVARKKKMYNKIGYGNQAQATTKEIYFISI